MTISPSRSAFLALGSAALAPGFVRAAAPVTGEPYKIGMTYPLTGSLAQLAGDQIAAAHVAVEDINRTGGVQGHPLALVLEDTQGTPQGGISAMRKLVQVDGVQAILTVFTNVVTAQMPLADTLRVPTLSTVQTAGLVSKSAYSFANSVTMPAEAALLQRFWKARGYKRIFAFYGNNAFGQQVAPIAKASVTAAPERSTPGVLGPRRDRFPGRDRSGQGRRPRRGFHLHAGQRGRDEHDPPDPRARDDDPDLQCLELVL